MRNPTVDGGATETETHSGPPPHTHNPPARTTAVVCMHVGYDIVYIAHHVRAWQRLHIWIVGRPFRDG